MIIDLTDLLIVRVSAWTWETRKMKLYYIGVRSLKYFLGRSFYWHTSQIIKNEQRPAHELCAEKDLSSYSRFTRDKYAFSMAISEDENRVRWWLLKVMANSCRSLARLWLNGPSPANDKTWKRNVTLAFFLKFSKLFNTKVSLCEKCAINYSCG